MGRIRTVKEVFVPTETLRVSPYYQDLIEDFDKRKKRMLAKYSVKKVKA